MTDKPTPPDYELADRIALTRPSQVSALGHPLRNTILSLLHERAATVTELATAVGRPKSTVAHHVKVLTDAELLRVVRTRRVRAIEERFYGRMARMFYVDIERAPGEETGAHPLPTHAEPRLALSVGIRQIPVISESGQRLFERLYPDFPQIARDFGKNRTSDRLTQRQIGRGQQVIEPCG